MIIRKEVSMTLEASPVNSRGYKVPPDGWMDASGIDPNGVATTASMEGSMLPTVSGSKGRADPRLLKGDAFSVWVGVGSIISPHYDLAVLHHEAVAVVGGAAL